MKTLQNNVRTIDDILIELNCSSSSPPVLIKQGLSGSKIYKILHEDRDLVIKIGEPDLIKSEANHYKKLSQYLNGSLAVLDFSGEGYLCREFLPGDTWYKFLNNGADIEDVGQIKPLFASLSRLWLETFIRPNKPVFQSHHAGPGRFSRLDQFLLSDYYSALGLDSNFFVDESKTLTIREAAKVVYNSFVTELPFVSLTHGDAKGDNIIGDRLIDPRPTYYDWVYDLAMMSRWRCSITLLSLSATMVKNRNSVVIVSDASFSPVCDELERCALEIGQIAADIMGDHKWRKRLYCYWGRMWLGDIRLSKQRIKLGIIKPCPDYTTYFLGQALKYLTLSKGTH